LALGIKNYKGLEIKKYDMGLGGGGACDVWLWRKYIQNFCWETGIKRPFGSH
jgi:hypothetical protein